MTKSAWMGFSDAEFTPFV